MAIKSNVKVRIRKKFNSKTIKKKYNDALKKALDKIALKGKENLRSEIRKRRLIDTGTLYNSIDSKVIGRNKIKFTIGPDYAKYVDQGVRRHKMVYLTDSESPIPIDVANNVFRWASKKAIKNGKFVHPGFRGANFTKTAMKRTKEDSRKELKKVTARIFKVS